MSKLLITVLVLAGLRGLAGAKLPPLSDEAKAKAAEAAAKTAWSDKVAAYQLCKAMDRVAAHYLADAKKARQDPQPTATPPCADPGPFAYAPAAPAKPLEAAGAAFAGGHRRRRRRAPRRRGAELRRRRSPDPASPTRVRLPASTIRRRQLAENMTARLPLPLCQSLPRLTHAGAPLTREIEVLDEYGQRRTHPHSRRAAADAVRRQARAGHADDAGRRARTAGAGLPAQPAAGRSRSTTVESVTVDWDVAAVAVQTRDGIERLRAQDRAARRHHRLRPGHGVRRPDGRARQRCAARRRRPRASASPRCTRMLEAMRQQDSIHRKAGSVHGCALFSAAREMLMLRRGRRPPQRDRHHRRLDVDATACRGADKVFYTTGRLTSEMVMKVGADRRADHRLAQRRHGRWATSWRERSA